MNKLKSLLLAAFLVLVPLGATPILAQDINCDVAPWNTTVYCEEYKTPSDPAFGPNGIITQMLQIIIIVVAIAAVITIVVGGMRIVFSGGDSQGVAGARQAIIYAVVGLLIAILAQAIVTFVLKELG